MSLTRSKPLRTVAAALGASAIVLGVGILAPAVAYAAPAPAPADPTVLFEEPFENGTTADVIGLTAYTGVQGATYTADPFWLDASACNGLVLNGGANWSGAGAPCATPESRARLADLAGVLGNGNTSNHIVAAYTDKNGPAGATLLARSEGSGIQLTKGRFYVAGIDIAEVNCFASAKSTISFGLVLPSGEVMIDGDPIVTCASGQTTTVNGHEIKYGTFHSAGFKAPESGPAEYVARNLQTSGGGNDFAYDNLRFLDATPTLHKSFSADTVEVGQPVTMNLTVVNTSERSEKTGWGFADTFPTGMTIADEPNVTSSCAAGDVTADAGSGELVVAAGSLADGSESCTISVDVVLAAGGEFTNLITDMDGLDGTPTDTVRALVPSLSLTKSVAPAALTADNREATYTFVVVNDGDVDLHDVKVTDPGPIGGTGTLGPIDCGGVTELAVDDELVCTAVYTAGLNDLTGTDLKNTANATGVSPAGTTVEDGATATLPTVTPKPELTLVKSADVETATKVGQSIVYSFVVTNTGNVTVKDVAVAEGSFSGKGTLSDVACPDAAASLAPAATVTCTATYTVVAADLTGKPITNTATAEGVGPAGAVESNVATAEVKTEAPAAPKPPVLAQTGTGSDVMVGTGAFVLLAAGVVVLLAARRQRLS